MSFDLHANLMSVTVTVPPSPAISGSTVGISNADRDKLLAAGLAAPFNMVVGPATGRNEANVEIVRVTAIGAHDTSGIGNAQLIITRQAEVGGINRSIQAGDTLTNNITLKTITDLESAITGGGGGGGINLAIPGPEGFLINGQIVTSVASNNLTVAIKTLAGVDPSASTPVYVRLGNTLYTLTSPLAVTMNAGANWFQSGNAEVATQEIDYFVYLGFNATDGVTIGVARIPYARFYSDFNATNSNPNYGAISTIVHAASSDVYVVIGRVNAILSAGTSYNWSLPGTSVIVNRPIFNTRVLKWTPVISSFTLGNALTDFWYKIDNQIIDMSLWIQLGSTTVVGGSIIYTTPFSISIGAGTANSQEYIGLGIATQGATRQIYGAISLDIDGQVSLLYNGSNVNASTPAAWSNGHRFTNRISYKLP